MSASRSLSFVQNNGRAVPVFCALAPRDDAYRQQLETHLSTLIQQEHITFWHNQGFEHGRNRKLE